MRDDCRSGSIEGAVLEVVDARALLIFAVVLGLVALAGAADRAWGPNGAQGKAPAEGRGWWSQY